MLCFSLHKKKEQPMQPIKSDLLQDVHLWLGSSKIDVGCCIAWLETQSQSLLRSDMPTLQALGRGVVAWLKRDLDAARKAWREAWTLGLQKPQLACLLGLVEPTPPSTAHTYPTSNNRHLSGTNPAPSLIQERLCVYVDGSFCPRTSAGGVSCVYWLDGRMVVLSESLPAPVSCSNYAEIKAIYLAISTPVLEPYPLAIFTDSQTAYMAVSPDHPSPKLLPVMQRLAEEVKKLLLQRNAKIAWIKSRIGNVLHNQADLFAGQISKFAQTTF